MPLAGAGSRFKSAGVETPKPLIEVEGLPMCRLVWENVVPQKMDFRLTVLANWKIADPLCDALAPSVNRSVPVNRVTQGAACTVLLASDTIDNYDPLMIVNGDQYIEGLDIDIFLNFAKDYHGAIMTFNVAPDDPPKWSYVERHCQGAFASQMHSMNIQRVAEKKAISREATCGIYWFRHGRDFLRAANAMITKDLRTNGEFYICPVYNEMIAEGLTIGAWNVNNYAGRMWGLGTPEDLEKLLARSDPAEWTDKNVEAVRSITVGIAT